MKNQEKKWQIPFFTIWTGQQLSLVGSGAAQFALIWYLTKTTGSATVLATSSLMGFLPTVFLGPFVGALVDRWNRRIVMIVADAVIALASFGLAYLFWVDALQVWHIYVVLFVRAVGSGFHWPAMEASTSLMVPEDQLTRVAGLNQTVKGVLNIIGAPLGALLMELLPLYGIMLMDVGTAALAIVPLFFVRIPQPERTDADKTQKQSILADVREGVRYLRGWPGMMAIIVMLIILKIVLTPAFSLAPLLVSEHFRGTAAQLSMIEVAVGIGFVIGGLLLSTWGGFKRRIHTIALGWVVGGLSLAALGLAPAAMFWIALVSVFVFGLAAPLVDGPFVAVLQASVAPEMQGRVLTLVSSLLNLTSPISLMIAGPVSDRLGLQMWYVVGGLLTAVAGLVSLMIPVIANIEQNNNETDVVEEEAPMVSPTPIPVDVE
ncbi:MAG: MFS transporter [Chloroflexi bacterium]|nr:MFS transporter [Chloroflexota bacterium]